MSPSGIPGCSVFSASFLPSKIWGKVPDTPSLQSHLPLGVSHRYFLLEVQNGGPCAGTRRGRLPTDLGELR